MEFRGSLRTNFCVPKKMSIRLQFNNNKVPDVKVQGVQGNGIAILSSPHPAMLTEQSISRDGDNFPKLPPRD